MDRHENNLYYIILIYIYTYIDRHENNLSTAIQTYIILIYIHIWTATKITSLPP